MIIVLSKSLKKETSHVVDHHRDSDHPVATRLFRSEHKFKLSADGRLGPYFDRYRRHPHRFAPVGNCLDPRFCDNRRGGQAGRLFMHIIQKAYGELHAPGYCLIALFSMGRLG